MVSKTFYKMASDEIANGAIDDALQIKIDADMPDADYIHRRARYIQLRAQELAVSAAGNSARRTMNDARSFVVRWAPLAVKTAGALVIAVLAVCFLGWAFATF